MKVTAAAASISGVADGSRWELKHEGPSSDRRRVVAANASGSLGRCAAGPGGARRACIRRRLCRLAAADLLGRAWLQRARDRRHRDRDPARHGSDDALGRVDRKPAFPASAASCGCSAYGGDRSRLRGRHEFLAASAHRHCRYDEPDLGRREHLYAARTDRARARNRGSAPHCAVRALQCDRLLRDGARRPRGGISRCRGGHGPLAPARPLCS